MDYTTTQPSPPPLHLQLAAWLTSLPQQSWETTTMSNDGLIFEIISRMNADEIVEVLDLEIEDLVEALRDHIIDNRERFNDYLEVDE